MELRNNFAAFILTHGRPHTVVTDKTLRASGYTGRIFYVVDDEDKTVDEYVAKYGSSVLVFDKAKYADMVDEGNNFDDRRTTTHARNAIFDLAADNGADWFVQLDDDYRVFSFRTNAEGQYPEHNWVMKTSLDSVFESVLSFMDKCKTVRSISLAQGGDYIGGAENKYATNPTLTRKCMNSFFCSTQRRFWFRSQLNEDVNTYLALGHTGDVFMTTPLVSLDQAPTQLSEGGMTGVYKDSGTYVKTFSSVMYLPSSVKVSVMGMSHRRVHHWVNWRAAVPQIVGEDQRKANVKPQP